MKNQYPIYVRNFKGHIPSQHTLMVDRHKIVNDFFKIYTYLEEVPIRSRLMKQISFQLEIRLLFYLQEIQALILVRCMRTSFDSIRVKTSLYTAVNHQYPKVKKQKRALSQAKPRHSHRRYELIYILSTEQGHHESGCSGCADAHPIRFMFIYR